MSNATSQIFATAQECATEINKLRAQRIACCLQKVEGGFTVLLMNDKAQPKSETKAKTAGSPDVVYLRLTPDGGVWSNKGKGFKPVTNMTFDECRESLSLLGYQKEDKNMDLYSNQTWVYRKVAKPGHGLDLDAYVKGLEDSPASFGHGDVPLKDFGMYCVKIGSYIEVSVPFNKGAASIQWLSQYASIHDCEVTPFECEGEEPEDYIYALSVCIRLYASSVSKELYFKLRNRSI